MCAWEKIGLWVPGTTKHMCMGHTKLDCSIFGVSCGRSLGSLIHCWLAIGGKTGCSTLLHLGFVHGQLSGVLIPAPESNYDYFPPGNKRGGKYPATFKPTKKDSSLITMRFPDKGKRKPKSYDLTFGTSRGIRPWSRWRLQGPGQCWFLLVRQLVWYALSTREQFHANRKKNV